MPDKDLLDKIFIKDLDIEMLIGIYPKEKENKQRVIVNLEAWVDPVSNLHDNYEDAVCYEQLINHIETAAFSEHINLVETLAEKISASCLSNPKIKRVKIRVEKPDVIERAKSVGIEIVRSR